MREFLEFFEIQSKDELGAISKQTTLKQVGVKASTGAGAAGGWGCTNLVMWCGCNN